MAEIMRLFKITAGSGYPGNVPKDVFYRRSCNATEKCRELLLAVADSDLNPYGGVEMPDYSVRYGGESAERGKPYILETRPAGPRAFEAQHSQVKMTVHLDCRILKQVETRTMDGEVTTVRIVKEVVKDWHRGPYAVVWMFVDEVKIEVADE